MIFGFIGITINFHYHLWGELALAALIMLFGFYLANKEEDKKIIQHGTIKVFQTTKKNTFFCQIENNKFENIKENLLKQYEPLGYKLSMNLQNILKLTITDSYIQLKIHAVTNTLTLETFNVEMPNIVKELGTSKT